MYGIFFKKVDCKDCKIIAFEFFLKNLFLHYAYEDQQTLNSLGFKCLHYTKLRLLILYWKIELKIQQKIKIPKNLHFHSLKGH
jgi:hypothetical protein